MSTGLIELQPVPGYRAYTIQHLRDIPQLETFSERTLEEMELVAKVLPFRTNNHVVENLIDWGAVPNDPMFVLNFPQPDMLEEKHKKALRELIDAGADEAEMADAIEAIRRDLNPHPAGQMTHNVPVLDGRRLSGLQHKYAETVLCFPSAGQTCHAYCTFCFRWPQFVGMQGMKFSQSGAEDLLAYVQAHEEVNDILFTGGDPLIMRTRVLRRYIEPVLEADPEHVQTIRIGTKALSYWPYRFTADSDAEDLLALFRDICDSGRHVAIMSHVNHAVELKHPAVKEAVDRIRRTGAVIRTQTPVLANINDSSDAWVDKINTEIRLGLIPYYMFLPRDTGAQPYFEVTLERALRIYRGAYRRVSGLGRTLRGPSMSAFPGKVRVLGIRTVNGEKVFVLNLIQARNPGWVGRPFFAAYDPKAAWLDDLRPAFGQKRFFFEEEKEQAVSWTSDEE